MASAPRFGRSSVHTRTAFLAFSHRLQVPAHSTVHKNEEDAHSDARDARDDKGRWHNARLRREHRENDPDHCTSDRYVLGPLVPE